MSVGPLNNPNFVSFRSSIPDVSRQTQDKQSQQESSATLIVSPVIIDFQESAFSLRLTILETLLTTEFSIISNQSKQLVADNTALVVFVAQLDQILKEYQYLADLALLPRITAQTALRPAVAKSGVAGSSPKTIVGTSLDSTRKAKQPAGSGAVSMIHHSLTDALSTCNIVILAESLHADSPPLVSNDLPIDALVETIKEAGISTIFCEKFTIDQVTQLATGQQAPVIHYLDTAVFKRPIGSHSPSVEIVRFLDLCLDQAIAIAPMGDNSYRDYEEKTAIKPIRKVTIDLIHHSYYTCIQLHCLTFSMLDGVTIPLPHI